MMKTQLSYVKTNIEQQGKVIKKLLEWGYELEKIKRTSEKVVFKLRYHEKNYETFSNWLYPYDLTVESVGTTLNLIREDNEEVFKQLIMDLAKTKIY